MAYRNTSFETASLEERRQWAREYIAACERGYLRELQKDTEADQRAFERGHGDLDPGPISQARPQSSTNRTANL